MHTTTLLVVVGCLVCVKTLAFVAVLRRRDRRQRRDLEAARAVGGAARTEAPAWNLQWAEPGVMLVENAGDASGARDVELSATLTASCGTEASVQRGVRFVGRGACFEARFTGLVALLTALAADSVTASPRDREEARRRLGCTLSYTVSWSTPAGEQRDQARLALPVLPVPDLALESA